MNDELYENLSSINKIQISIVAGGIGGLIGDFSLHPLDTIKTRIQYKQKNNDLIKKAKNISLFSGLSSQLFVAFPATSGYFSSYEGIKILFKKKHPSLNEHVVHQIGGSVAEIVSNSIRNPFEIIKQQMQIGLDSSNHSTIKNIYKTRGLKGFYAGYLSLLLREVPFSAIQLPIYEIMKKFCKKQNLKNKYDKELTIFQYSSCGGISAGISGFLTTPIDVIKTRLMTERGKKIMGTIECFNSILNNEGYKGFWKAWHYRTVSVSIGGVFLFGFYETSKKFIVNKYYTVD